MCTQKEKQNLVPQLLCFCVRRLQLLAYASDGKWGLGPEQPELGLDPGEL